LLAPLGLCTGPGIEITLTLTTASTAAAPTPPTSPTARGGFRFGAAISVRLPSGAADFAVDRFAGLVRRTTWLTIEPVIEAVVISCSRPAIRRWVVIQTGRQGAVTDVITSSAAAASPATASPAATPSSALALLVIAGRPWGRGRIGWATIRRQSRVREGTFLSESGGSGSIRAVGS
jgi:hypothetical protein